ncbi:hypothetical protein F511_45693 [Dorcoceras hygrometricum]|uniref:Uncharacterized protein n=1 Tax=Dorcoceras hygrometricum TaxID=472368 RepID=A0A2Z6ZVD7_9LAMI|nr:hypothetical protein F511_45693 [Dorcoceras hygrometricum]
MSVRDMRADRAREANSGRNSMRDDGLAVRKRLREWPVDAGGWVHVLVAPPRAYVAQIRRPLGAGCAPCCAAGSAGAMAGRSTLAGDVARRWLDEARWLRTMRAGRATLRAASCAAAAIFVVAASPSSAAAPASLWRCRDGWSDFSMVWFGPVPGSP